MLRGATRILAVLLVVMYQVRWFLQHQPLKLCKRRQRKVWSFMLKALWENGEDVPEWLKNGDYEFVYNFIR